MESSIKNLDLFNNLNENEIAILLEVHKLLSFKKDHLIIEESNIEFDFYLLASGRVSVEMNAPGMPDGKEQKQITVLNPGESFGEITFLEGMRRSANIRALTDVTVMRFDGQELHSILEKETKIGYIFMKNLSTILSRRVRDLNFKWRNQC